MFHNLIFYYKNLMQHVIKPTLNRLFFAVQVVGYPDTKSTSQPNIKAYQTSAKRYPHIYNIWIIKRPEQRQPQNKCYLCSDPKTQKRQKPLILSRNAKKYKVLQK